MAPIDRGLEGALPRHRRARAPRQQHEPLAHRLGDLLRRQQSHACRRQLDRQGDSVQAPTDRRHRLRVRVDQAEIWSHLSRPIAEQLDRFDLRERGSCQLGLRNLQRGNPPALLSLDPIDSRLVARITTPGHASSSVAANSAHAPSRCSQLSSAINNRRSASCAVSVSITGCDGNSRIESALATSLATSAESLIGARSTHHTPSGVIVKRLGGHLQGQPCLPAPTRSGQSEQARSAEQLTNLCDLGLAADEAGELDGQVVREG